MNGGHQHKWNNLSRQIPIFLDGATGALLSGHYKISQSRNGLLATTSFTAYIINCVKGRSGN